jgi:imidazolonepropionase-like amidohydrolase
MDPDLPPVNERARRHSRATLWAMVAFFVLVAFTIVVRRGPGEGRLIGHPIAIVDVTVFDGSRFIEDRTVVVLGDTITAVEPAGEIDLEQGTEIIEGRDRTLLPAFIDAHVHLGLTDPRAVLEGGVTIARDLGWPLERVQDLAGRLGADREAGPFLWFAGPMLTAPGGYPARASWAPAGTAREIADPDQARAAVNELADDGALVIKVALDPRAGPILDEATLRAVVEAAHERDREVTCHCATVAELARALDAGIDELAHGLWDDTAITDALIERMIEADVTLVPTLHVGPTRARIDNVRRFASGGGRVVYGTDMGNDPASHGIDVDELDLMRRAGMTLEGVLAAATSVPARTYAFPGGLIEPDARADLILVAGDPRDDLDVLGNPILVMRSGQVVHHEPG